MITSETQSSWWLSHLAFAALYIATGLPVLLIHVRELNFWLGSAALAALLIPLSAIDARTLRLPDALTLPLVVGGLTFCATINISALPKHAIAAAIAFLSLYGVEQLYLRMRGRAGLGRGDAKLFAAGGAWTGLEQLADVMLAATIIALAWIGWRALLGLPIQLQSKIAFGPFLALAIWLVWLHGMS